MNSRRIREGYLKAVLRQDIAYFDGLGAGEVATRIQSDTGEFASVERPITPKTSTSFKRELRKRRLWWFNTPHLFSQVSSVRVSLPLFARPLT